MLSFILSIILTFSIVNNAFASHKVLNDNFNDGNLDGWVRVDDPDRTPCSASWIVNSEGMAGISINQGSCTTNLMPSDAVWNNLGDNYVFEFDMKFVRGTDHNVAFRFTPSSPSNDWYDLHFISPGDFVLERVNPGSFNVNVPMNFPNNNLYHFKIIVNENNIKVYANNNLVRDYTSITDRFPHGRIALRAGTGSDSNSETYFDNIVVTSIDDISPGIDLPVPYFSQNALPWGSTEYDHSLSLGFQNPTMDRWGCLVTSAAMVLNYHGMTEFPDGSAIDPGSLNVWLKNNNGYQTGKNKNGEPFSKFVWSAIPRLTRELFQAGKSSYKLIHNRLGEGQDKNVILQDDLSNGKLPGILGVSNAETDMHFVVAKGKTSDSYAVNDPEWNYPDLKSFDNNDFFQFDRYVKSNTNFSYIEMSINEEVEILVIDPEGRKTGKQVQNGVVQDFNEIPNATYSHSGSLSNGSDNLGIGFNEFLLPEPEGGEYKIIISGKEPETYNLNIATVEENGDDKNIQLSGLVSSENSDQINLNYSQTNPSNSFYVLSFESLIEDTKALRRTGGIKNLGTYMSLLVKAGIASEGRSIKSVSGGIIKSMLSELNGQRGKGITENAYQILKNDIEYLLNSSK